VREPKQKPQKGHLPHQVLSLSLSKQKKRNKEENIHSSETLLARCVPDLQGVAHAVDLHLALQLQRNVNQLKQVNRGKAEGLRGVGPYKVALEVAREHPACKAQH
jgi:hypothetical protein